MVDNKHLPMVIRTIPLLRKSFFFIYQWKVSYRKRSFNREGDIYRKGTYSVFWPKTPQGNQLNLKRVIQFGRRNDKLSMFLRFMDILVVFHNFLSYFPFYLSGLCAKEWKYWIILKKQSFVRESTLLRKCESSSMSS